ncbi:MAG: serine hydrolase [Acidimicrobiales bacterium]
MGGRHRRRGTHRRAWGAGLVVLVAAGALIAWSASTGPASGPGVATRSPPSSTTTSTSVAPTTAPAPTPTTAPRARLQNPFTTPAARAFLASVTGNLTAGVYDLTSHLTYLYRPGIPEYTASLVKIDILATLLHEAEVGGHPLSARQQRLATSMIEDSSNPAASVLWAQAGGRDAVAAFDQAVGMTQTIPSWSWGAIATTPRDQLRLLRVITQPNALLGPAARAFEGSLMAQVVGFERFGVG